MVRKKGLFAFFSNGHGNCLNRDFLSISKHDKLTRYSQKPQKKYEEEIHARWSENEGVLRVMASYFSGLLSPGIVMAGS